MAVATSGYSCMSGYSARSSGVRLSSVPTKSTTSGGLVSSGWHLEAFEPLMRQCPRWEPSGS
eukprot:scaffold32864_cov28-Tisochrysis_lutea.AAC.1